MIECPTPQEIHEAVESADDERFRAILDHVAGCERCDTVACRLIVAGDEETATYIDSLASTCPSGFVERIKRLRRKTDSIGSAIGTKLGNYEVMGKIDGGGMGVVYKARQVPLNRIVALKVIRGDQLDTADAVQRFQSEAQAGATLSHPGIVPVYEVGEVDGLQFYSMELIDGPSLAARLDEGTLASRPAAELLLQLARAVTYAHEHGVIHRDLKPRNILIQKGQSNDANGFPKEDGHAGDYPRITDFGLAKRIETDSGLTSTGQILGTPSYMSPEQAAGRTGDVKESTDVYSLGAVLYCVLTSRPPFQGESVTETLRLVIEQEPVPPRRLNPSIKRELETICLKCLEKDPARRYSSAQALAADLNRFLDGRPIQAKPIRMLGRAIKYARRRPARAGLLAAIPALVIIAAGFFAYYAYSQQQRALTAEEHSQEIIERERRIAEERRERESLLYKPRLNVAKKAISVAQVESANAQLDAIVSDSPVIQGNWEWSYLKRLCNSERIRLIGHNGKVNCLAYRDDGALVASGSADGTVRLWDPRTGKTKQVLRGHLHAVTCLAFSPDGSKLATGSVDATAKLWEVATGRELATMNGSIVPINDVKFHPGKKQLAVASSDGIVQFYDIGAKRPHITIQGNFRSVARIAFDPAGTQLAVAGTESFFVKGQLIAKQSVVLWDMVAKKRGQTIASHTGYLEFTQDGKQLILAQRDGIQVYNRNERRTDRSIVRPVDDALRHMVLADRTINFFSGRSISLFVQPNLAFPFATLSRDGKRICTVDRSGVSIRDMASGKVVRRLPMQAEVAAWSPDGRHIAIPHSDRAIRIFTTETDPEGLRLRGHVHRITSLVFSPDGKQLASGSADHSIKTWNTSNRRELRHFGGHKIKMTVATKDRPAILQSIETISGHSQMVRRVAYSTDGRYIASAGQDATLRIWDAATGRELHKRTYPAAVTSVAFSPDGKHLAAGCWDDLAYLIESPTGKILRKFTGHTEDVYGVVFLNQGRQLATVGRDDTLRIWDVKSGWQLQKLTDRYIQGPRCIAADPDGRLLAVGGGSMVITLWDTSTWKVTRTMAGHSSRIDDLTFSPNGQRLISASGRREDGTVKIWDVTSGLDLLSLPGAYAVAFSPDGKRIATGLRPHDIRIYDSRPIDDQPFRLAKYKPPPADKVKAGDDGSLRVLGAFHSRVVRVKNDKKPVIKLPEGKVCFAVAGSLPNHRLIPSAQRFQQIVAAYRADGDVPPPARENVLYCEAGQFQLRLPGGKSIPAKLVAQWPVDGSGFVSRTYGNSSSRFRKQLRKAFVVAWIIDARDVQKVRSMQFDRDRPAKVPRVQLIPPETLVPSQP